MNLLKKCTLLLLSLLLLLPAALPVSAAGDVKERSKMIYDGDVPFGDGTADTAIKTQGAASNSFLLQGFCVQALTGIDLDISDYDTLEMDIWIQTADFFTLLFQSQFELTSSGTCDVNEMSWNTQRFADYLTDGSAKVGWNHVAIPFFTASETGDKIDLHHVNFMRWYFVQTEGIVPEEGLIVKLDNVRATNRWEMERDKVLATVQPTLDLLGSLDGVTQVTKKNVDRIRQTAEAARDSYDSLTTMQQNVIDPEQYKLLTNAEKLIRLFEILDERGEAPEGEDETEPPETVPTDPQDTEDPNAAASGDGPVTEYNEPLIFGITFILVLLISVIAFFAVKKKEAAGNKTDGGAV